MEIPEYLNIYQNEETHFFYVSNHNFVLKLLQKYSKGKLGLKILDAGCGTGLLIKKLEKYGDVVGVDFEKEAVRLSKKRGVKVQKASVNKLPFPANSFDVITSVDVLYHKNVVDLLALSEFRRVLKKDGILILRVPAIKWLRTSHDSYVHTRERYNRGDLKQKLQKSNFQILKLSYINVFLLPFTILESIFGRFENKPKSIVTKLPSFINNLVINVLNCENFIIERVNLPIGLGLIAVCKKS